MEIAIDSFVAAVPDALTGANLGLRIGSPIFFDARHRASWNKRRVARSGRNPERGSGQLR